MVCLVQVRPAGSAGVGLAGLNNVCRLQGTRALELSDAWLWGPVGSATDSEN